MKGQYQVEGNCYFMLPFTTDPDLPETVIQQLDLEGHEVHQANRMTSHGQLFQFIKQWEGKKLSLLWRSRMVLITSLAKWSTICWPGTQILLCFVSMTNSAIFAYLVLTKNQKMWWYNLFLKMNFEGCTFKQWKKQGQFTAWPGMTLCRCVFVPSSEEGSSGYVWAVLKHYQHDWEAVQTIIRELLDETMTWPTVHHLESVFCLNSHTSGHSHLFLFGLYGDECMGNGTMRIEIHQSQPTTVI